MSGDKEHRNLVQNLKSGSMSWQVVNPPMTLHNYAHFLDLGLHSSCQIVGSNKDMLPWSSTLRRLHELQFSTSLTGRPGGVLDA